MTKSNKSISVICPWCKSGSNKAKHSMICFKHAAKLAKAIDKFFNQKKNQPKA